LKAEIQDFENNVENQRKDVQIKLNKIKIEEDKKNNLK